MELKMDALMPQLNSSLALIIVAALLCYVLLLCLYRVFWHPLARYPGPILGCLTDWYSVYHALKGDRHLDFYQLHSKYGKIVRFGPNRISINSAEGLKAIYGTHANTQKSTFYSVFDHFFDVPSTETLIDKQQHARKRRILAKALSEKFLKESEPTFVRHYDLLCDLFKPKDATDGWSETSDMAQLFGRYTFDVMGDICFGQSFDTLIKSENIAIMSTISDGVQALNAVGHMPGLLNLGLERLVLPRLIKGLDFYKSYSREVADGCTKEGRVSVATSLLPDKDDVNGESLSYAELVVEVSLLIVAGSDTTANALSSTLFHLLHNPTCMARLRAEIDAAFSSPDEIVTGRKLAACSFLSACITESLRLSPPVGGLLAREVLAGGLITDGIVLPKGTEVGTPFYTLHHNEDYYRDPWKFDPERWLRDNEAAQSAFCAFSTGPRGCIGKRMAHVELTMVLARLIWQYDIRLAGDAKDLTAHDAVAATKRRDSETVDKFVGKVRGPFAQFRKRERL